MRRRTSWRITIACAGVLIACKSDDPTPEVSPNDASERAPAGSTGATIAAPSSTPLPDCDDVDTTLVPNETPLSPVANARREPAHPQIVARVGDAEIPNSALDAIFALKVRAYTSRGREPPQFAADRYRTLLARRLVSQEILRQEVVARGIRDDEAALATSLNAHRSGIIDYDDHLRRLGETEQSTRDSMLSHLREEAIVAAIEPIRVDDAQLVAAYCRRRDEWPIDREHRVVSHLMFASKDTALEAIAVLGHDAGITELTELATRHPDRPFAAHALFSPRDGVFFEGVFAAPVGRPTVVEAGSATYVVLVEQSFAPGSLPREVVFDAVREEVRQHEIGKRRATLWSGLLAKYPVTLFGVPDVPEASAAPSAPE